MKKSWFVGVIFAALMIAGCSGSTAVSRQPSRSEIDEGIARRIAAIDKMNISDAQKERMKQQIRGTAPSEASARQEGLQGNTK